jgi:ankyrin repeat protein
MRRPTVVVVAILVVASLGAGRRSTLLIDAVKDGDLTVVRAELRQRGVDVNAPEVDGTTALHWAVERDDLAMVEALLRAGANAKAVNRFGVSPLAPAATNGNAAMLELLIKAGADPNTALPGGETALLTASRTGNIDAIKTLLAHGAKVDARETRRGQTALMWAASNNNATAIRVLVEAGADINARATGPQLVSRTGLRGGVGAYGQNRTREDAATPFLFAVRRGHMEAAKTLLDLGASVNDQLPDKTSALVVAVANAHWELAAYLLDRGADPNADGQGWGPLHQLARTRRGLDVNRYPWPEVTGTMSGLELARKLVARGADINRKMTRKISDDVRNNVGPGCTPFAMAAKADDLPLLKVFLELGADPNIRNVNETTPLMLAVGVEMFNPGEDTHDDQDAIDTTKFLLDLGAPINAKNKYGESALLGATARGPIPLVQLLLDHGASFEVKDLFGWTPLISAEWGKNYGGQQLKNPEMGKYIREQMTKRGLSTDRPTDDELYARMFGPCGHGANVNPAPSGGTLGDRCKPGRDLRNVQRGNVPLPEDLALPAQ